MNYHDNRKSAFTLAEVLITLGIIGVVAALTLPTVIGNYQKQATVSKLKKVYTTLNQAMKRSEADNGEYRNWASVSDIGGDAYFDQYWKPYLTKAKICKTYQECGYSSNKPWEQLTGAFEPALIHPARLPIILPDGTLIVILTLSGTDETSGILVDLNAGNPPNIYCKDFFWFYRNVNGQIYPTGYKGTKTITAGHNCSWVIMSNGWKIPDDYPW